MPTRKRQQAEGEQREPRRRHASDDSTIKAPEFNTCKYLFEAVSPEFDPKRVLLRRVFFIDEDKSRYVSVGFYPTQNYQSHVEFGGPRIKPVIFEDEHVETLAEFLPKICAAMCDDEQFAYSDSILRLTTTGSYKKARLYKDKHYITQFSGSALPNEHVSCCSQSTKFIYRGSARSSDLRDFCTKLCYICRTCIYC